ncbi:hypothetical protein TcasGA2_TC013302 [Tribolium castaneum]|uniref:Uncharacterized protein n=1 Tax=Tribolium castaneum TaxID=7070 RepID=D6WMC1_TRICA|nr:hypothetical protein TcasGA2_TC013302 [Tribolium castaneum]
MTVTFRRVSKLGTKFEPRMHPVVPFSEPPYSQSHYMSCRGSLTLILVHLYFPSDRRCSLESFPRAILLNITWNVTQLSEKCQKRITKLNFDFSEAISLSSQLIFSRKIEKF